MKNGVLGVFAAGLLMVCNGFAAVNLYRVDVEWTNNPTDGNTLVIDGVTKTFKTTVTSPSTQVLIGADPDETVDNVMTHFVNYPLSTLTLAREQVATTNVSFVASQVGFVMTGSMSGSWGTVTVVITSITGYTVQMPLSILPATQHRTNVANDLIIGLRDYATTNFPSGESVLTNYVDLTTAKVISGANVFSGATVLSNANTYIKGGNLTGVVAKRIEINSTNDVIILNNFYRLTMDAAGVPTIYEDTGGGVNGSFASFTVGDGSIPNGVSGDGRWGKKTGVNTWSGASNVFTLLLRAENIQGIITNATGGFTNVWTDNLYVANIVMDGPFVMSNASPSLVFHDTTGGTDSKELWFTMTHGELSLNAVSDDQGTVNPVLMITRSGAVPIAVRIVNGEFQVEDSLKAYTAAYVGTFLGVGSTNMSAPAGMDRGLVLTNGTGPSAPATNGFVLWAASGEPGYRNTTGANNLLHNAAGSSTGSGSDYNLTGTYAQITFGGSVTAALPSAGTYLVRAAISVQADASNANDVISAKFYNSTDAADVTGSERTISSVPAAKRDFLALENVITVTAAKTLHIYGINSTSARGTIDSEQTTLTYVRLY